MTPRNQIHAIDITSEPSRLVQQLATSYHTRLPVYEDELDNIIGTLHLKQVLHLQHAGGIDRARRSPACCARRTSCRAARRC